MIKASELIQDSPLGIRIQKTPSGVFYYYEYAYDGLRTSGIVLSIINFVGRGVHEASHLLFIFNELGWLQYGTVIGSRVAVFGAIADSIAMLFGIWLLISITLGRKSLALPLKA